jgi:hypothetical protein
VGRGTPFEDPAPEVQEQVGQLMVQVREAFSTPGRNGADPWVIALVQASFLGDLKACCFSTHGLSEGSTRGSTWAPTTWGVAPRMIAA